MLPRALLLAAAWAALSLPAAGADRDWQEGIWVDIVVTRPRIVLGLRPSPFRPGRDESPAMTEVRTYVIVTRDWRIELKDPVPPAGRSVDALVGERVTFAIEEKTAYIRDPRGELKLRVAKTTRRLE
jgi:hypothetical protein